MKRRELCAALGGVTLAGVAGCITKSSEETTSPEEVDVWTDEASVEFQGEQAVWTWTGHIGQKHNDCELEVTTTLYDSEGREIAARSLVMRDLEYDSERTIRISLSREEGNSIHTYEHEIQSARCE